VKKILLLSLILIVPAVAYLVLQTGQNAYDPLPIYGPRDPVVSTVNGVTKVDTAYHTVGSFSLLSQDSAVITQDIARGKISVVDFFFSTCTTICPKMSNQLMRVQTTCGDGGDLVLLSFTVDPQNDTPSRLKQYADKHNARPGLWYFLTGPKDSIYQLARDSYFLNAMEGQGGGEAFLHSESFLLIDKEGRIRGIYDGTEHFEVKKLIEDIAALRYAYSQAS